MRIRQLADPSARVLRIGAVATVAEELLPRWLSDFRTRYPRANVHLEVANKARLLELLRAHRLDVVVAGRPGNEAGLRIVATRPHELVLCAAREWASRWFGDDVSVLTPERAAQVTWLLREPGSGTRASAEEVHLALDIQPPSLTIGSNLAIKRGVELGLGVAVLSSDLVAREIEQGLLVSLALGPLPSMRRWCLVVGPDGAPDPVRDFLEPLRAQGELEIPPVITEGAG